MPNETPTRSESWTFESLLAHLQTLIDAHDKRYEQRFRDAAMSVNEKLEANDKRYEQRFTDSKTAIEAALNAAKEAVTKAEAASEKRFEGVNEFRAALGDQQRTLMPRPEAALRFDALEKKIDAINQTLEKKVAALELAGAGHTGQKMGAKEMWAYIIAGIGILFGILSFFR